MPNNLSATTSSQSNSSMTSNSSQPDQKPNCQFWLSGAHWTLAPCPRSFYHLSPSLGQCFLFCFFFSGVSLLVCVCVCVCVFCALPRIQSRLPGHPRSCRVINHFGTFDAKENRRTTNIRLFAYQRSYHTVEFAILQVAPAGSLRQHKAAKTVWKQKACIFNRVYMYVLEI